MVAIAIVEAGVVMVVIKKRNKADIYFNSL